MTVEELDAVVQTAMDEWAESFRVPTEAFRLKLDAAVEAAKASGMEPSFLVVTLARGAVRLEAKLEEVVGGALNPNLMTIVATRKDGT